jgi:hypothetical protein
VCASTCGKGRENVNLSVVVWVWVGLGKRKGIAIRAFQGVNPLGLTFKPWYSFSFSFHTMGEIQGPFMQIGVSITLRHLSDRTLPRSKSEGMIDDIVEFNLTFDNPLNHLCYLQFMTNENS